MLRNITIFIALYIMSCLYSSCDKCVGTCNTVYTIKGAYLETADTQVYIKGLETLIQIKISPYVVKSNGDRNCPRKNEINCTQGALDTLQMQLSCDQDLNLQQGFFAKGTNLLSFDTLKLAPQATQVISGPILQLRCPPTFIKGLYHFDLKGITHEGVPYQHQLKIYCF